MNLSEKWLFMLIRVVFCIFEMEKNLHFLARKTLYPCRLKCRCTVDLWLCNVSLPLALLSRFFCGFFFFVELAASVFYLRLWW
jgi:hypothetical protein